MAPDFEVRAKSDASPVTEAEWRRRCADFRRSGRGSSRRRDRDQEQAASLLRKRSDVPDRRSAGRHQERVQRRGDFTVNIACVEDGGPLRGVVHAPGQGVEFFYTLPDGAGRGVKAPAAKTAGQLRPITVLGLDNRALMVVASKSHRDQATDDREPGAMPWPT